jgi:hypothetical protein
MTYPLPDHDINKHEAEHYPTRSNGIIPTWVKRREGKDARKYLNAWLDEMTPEERRQHNEREAEYQKSIRNAEYY